MDSKILKGTLVGGITFFLLGWLIWGLLLTDFSLTNYNQCMNRPQSEMIWWAIILSNLVSALFLTLILKWSGASVLIDGIKTGALIGFLLSLSIDLSYYSMSTMFNSFGAILVDFVVSSFMYAVAGALVVLLWGKK